MHTARNTVLLPALFLFYFLMFLVVLAGVDLLHLLLGRAAETANAAVLSDRIPAVVAHALPAACTGGLLALFFTMMKRPGSRLPSFVLVLVTLSAVLIFARLGLAALEPEPQSTPIPPPLIPGRFALIGGGGLYAEDISAGELRRAVVAREKQTDGGPAAAADPGPAGAGEWSLLAMPRASYRWEGTDLAIRPEGGEELTLRAPEETAAVGPTESLAPLLREYRLLNIELDRLLEDRFAEFVLLAVSMAFVLLSTQIFMRISRWPLFNITVVILAVRGLLFLYFALRRGYLAELQALVPEGLFERILPSLVFLALGVLLLLVDVLFVPYDFWQKRVDALEGGP
jgi:hypothetical protein